MIPIRLRLRNFMCYRENVPVLDFSGIHTACISGDNGNGKSALIDAMTWALWGVSRAGKDADSLISQGQNEMEVEFEFAIGRENYRIIRKRSRPKRATGAGQTILEFQIADNGGFKPLTAEGVVLTQKKIEETIHMDYDTFINSALLLQGRADEFTMQTPAKRIEVLATILGFSFYEDLAREANERAKTLEASGKQLESSIADMLHELESEPAAKAELDETEKELESASERVTEQEVRLDGLRREKEALEARERELSELEKRVQSAERSRRLWESQIEQHRKALKEYGEITARQGEIEKFYKELTEAKKLDTELSQKFRETTRFSEKKHQLEMKIQNLSQGILNRHALTLSKISELEQKTGEISRLKEDRIKIQARGMELARLENEVSIRRKENEELKAGIEGLKSTVAHLQQVIDTIDEKINLLAHDGNQCPLCESEIGEEGLERVRTKFTAEKAETVESLSSNKKELTQKQKELETSEKEFTSFESKLNREKADFQRHESLIDKGISEVEAAGKALTEAKQALEQIEESLAIKDYARNEEAMLSQIEAEIARLGYKSEEHDRVTQRISALERYDEDKRKLDEAGSKGPDLEKLLRNAEEELKATSDNLQADNARKSELAAALVRLPELRKRVKFEEAEQITLKRGKEELQQNLGKLKERLARYAELKKRKTERESTLVRTVEEEKIYRELAEAFGKKGIQTMLIEIALPDLENEANRLLSKMTDNRMHLKFETQKLSRKGDTLDTLDITIADELGTRNYEMYSGGEAFRINFAIRIALARLLARRAGAPLPTLVIDEGFGTQDATGIEKIKEAIASIQDDFDKVLVITHIEELRDAFPSRISVVKTAAGSTIEAS